MECNSVPDTQGLVVLAFLAGIVLGLCFRAIARRRRN